MIVEIVRVTGRQLLGRRRTVLLALFAALPVLLAVLIRIGGGASGGVADTDFVEGIFVAFIVTLLLPLVALLFGTAAFGAEIEDGTIVYLLSKPVPRWEIVVAKLAVAGAASAVLVGASTLVTGLVSLAGSPGGIEVAVGYTVGAAVGAVVYCAVFVALSLVTSRALVIGLVYVLIWEGTLASLFAGIRFLSVRQYVLGIADAAGVAGRITPDTLAAGSAVALAVVVGLLGTTVAVRRLAAFQIAQAD